MDTSCDKYSNISHYKELWQKEQEFFPETIFSNNLPKSEYNIIFNQSVKNYIKKYNKHPDENYPLNIRIEWPVHYSPYMNAWLLRIKLKD